MASNNFVNSFMTSFKDDLTTQADKSLKKYLKTYKDKLDKIEKTNQTNIQQNMVEYHKKRKELQDKFDQKINAMIAEASKKMDTQLTNIDDKLFTDRSKLYQKILTAAQDLQKKRDEFAKERRKWDKDDKRCAAWLGLSYKDTKPSKKDPKIKNDDDNKDDMKAGLDDDIEEPANSADNVDNLKIEKITDEDFITIKVDDRVFRTYRGTLTQVKGSFIQKLFGPHHDLIHRDNDGIYYLNCNPDTFGNVLEVLRKRGAMPADFKITPKLYAALVEYGILDTFFPTANLSELLAGLDIKKKQDYHVVFQSFRSSDNNSLFLRWNVNLLSSSDQKDDDDSQYWQLNANDNSEILFLKTGFYRITFRCCISCTAVTYGRIYVNGSATEICYHYNTNNGAHLKSYNFNDIKEFKEGDKLKLYAGVAANKEAKASYLCIERVPDAILPSVGIWTSSASNSYYRQWNATIKTSDRYTLANANKNITLQKGGLYRISGRMHTNYTSTGTRAMQLYEFRNGTNNGYYNNQDTLQLSNSTCSIASQASPTLSVYSNNNQFNDEYMNTDNNNNNNNNNCRKRTLCQFQNDDDIDPDPDQLQTYYNPNKKRKTVNFNQIKMDLMNELNIFEQQHKDRIKQLENTIHQKDQIIQQKDEIIQRQLTEIDIKDANNKQKDEEIKQLNDKIETVTKYADKMSNIFGTFQNMCHK